MAQNLKQRILGALVTLLALALLLPIILDSKKSIESFNTEVPAMPEQPDWAQVENEPRVRQELQELAEGQAEQALEPQSSAIAETPEAQAPSSQTQAASPQAQVPSTQDQEKPSTHTAKATEAWVLQVGAFSDVKNANGWRDKLRSKGYKAFTQNIANRKMTGVFVGPELKRDNLERVQTKLNKEFKMAAQIKPWQL